MSSTKTFEIYWNDLTETCQNSLLEFLGGDNGNYDVYPLVVLENPEDEGDDTP